MTDCDEPEEYGNIENGIILGVSEIALSKPSYEIAASMVYKGVRVNGVPCIGLLLQYDDETGSFELPHSRNIDSDVKIGYLDFEDLSLEILLDQTDWPERLERGFTFKKLVWSPISEILNNRHIYGIPIASEVSRVFEMNQIASFLFNDNGNVMPSPTVVYNGAYVAEIAASIGIGKSRASPYASFGPNYYFGSFPYARRFAVASLDKKERTVNGVLVTKPDSRGVFKKGAMTRYVLIEGRVSIDSDTKCSNTIIFPKEKYDGVGYVAKHFNSFELVDYVGINTSKVRTVDQAARSYITEANVGL